MLLNLPLASFVGRFVWGGLTVNRRGGRRENNVSVFLEGLRDLNKLTARSIIKNFTFLGNMGEHLKMSLSWALGPVNVSCQVCRFLNF